MEKPTNLSEADSRSMSERSTSDQDLKKRSTNSTASSGSNHDQNDSRTPMNKSLQNGQQSSTTPMAPPPKPNFKATPTSAQPLQSEDHEPDHNPPASLEDTTQDETRQQAQPSKLPIKSTPHATLRKRSHVEVDRQQPADDGDDTDEDREPADSIAPFDWMELESRYHQQMHQYGAQEQELYGSFSELCNYFYVWAETGHGHEVDRSFKRMKTQITLVQHEEQELEKKRLHYVKVVEAFKSALQLLSSD
ncbi:hypothetical protein E2P81_ATG10563 [Venturia nashicola]|nr:hypothetical protein E2P81_ATG10563 [Venturia nashicola]